MTVAEQYGITGRSSRSIAASVERGIVEGGLATGHRLPSVRSLAAALDVSPATVAAAYRDLRARGLVVAVERQGVQVAARPPLPTRLWDPLPSGVRDLASGSPDPVLLPALPSLAAPAQARLYGEETNVPALLDAAREAFADDGIAAGRIAVVNGAMDGVERVLAAHLRPGDAVAVEDPGYTAVLDLLRAMGLSPVAVSVDEGGMTADSLAAALGAGARAVVITPRAQNPTGAAITSQRARALASILADHPGVLVVEDDHAGPIAGAAHHTLTRSRARWAVVRSVAKSLGPDLRLAVVAGDEETVARVEGRLQLGPGWVSHILQRAVVALWQDPDVAALLERATAAYRERRDALIGALADHGITATGPSGLSVWVPVPEEQPVLRGLERKGWAVRGGERYRIASPPAIRVTAASLPPAEAPRFAADLAEVLRPAALAGRTRSA